MSEILNVNSDFESLDEEEAFFRDVGVDTVRCLGPDTSDGCWVLGGRECPKASRARVILCELDLDNEGHRHILAAYRESGAEVLVVVSSEEKARWGSELVGVTTIVGPPTRSDLTRVARSGSGADVSRSIGPEP